MRITTFSEDSSAARMISPRLLTVTAILIGILSGVVLWFTAGTGARQDAAENAFDQAQHLSRLGEAQSALAFYDEAIRLHPEHTQAYYGRGLLHEDLNHSQQAVDDFSHVIQLSPQQASAYYHRGFLYHLLGNNDAARQDFNKAVELDSHDAEAYLRRAAFFAKLEEYTQADADYSAALTLQPGNITIHALRGAVRSLMGDNKGAAEDYKIVNGNHGDPEAEQGEPPASEPPAAPHPRSSASNSWSMAMAAFAPSAAAMMTYCES